MLFHSIEFLFVFLPVTWIVFVVLVRTNRLRATCAWLAVASLVFYAWWNPPYLLLIGASILVNFWLGRGLCQNDGGRKPRVRLALLYLGMALNLGALGYFKYAGFFVGGINSILGTSFNLGHVILPLAISFFTFQQIVYLIDAYKGGNRRYGFIEYSFFVLFFPHLIAGPIVHHHELLPQLACERWKPVRLENLQVGMTIFCIGLFKKMVLADGCSEYAGPLFQLAGKGAILSGEHAWVAALSYSFQLYFDFSGYSDMAIGLARLFGIRLPMNFNSPYRAASMIDFWRRWHITLSRFLREYVYIPLGGNRKGITLRCSNVFITMLVGGLWHGAGWTFIVWGGLHGFYLIVNHLFHILTHSYFAGHAWARRVFAPFAWAITLVAVIVGWVFFRAPDFGTAVRMLCSMFHLQQGGPSVVPGDVQELFLSGVHGQWLVFVAAIALLAPSTQQYLRHYSPTLDEHPIDGRRFFPVWRPSPVHGIVIGILIFITIRRYFSLTPTEFLYFNF